MEPRSEILTSSHMLNMMYQIACGMVSSCVYFFVGITNFDVCSFIRTFNIVVF